MDNQALAEWASAHQAVLQAELDIERCRLRHGREPAQQAFDELALLRDVADSLFVRAALAEADACGTRWYRFWAPNFDTAGTRHPSSH